MGAPRVVKRLRVYTIGIGGFSVLIQNRAPTPQIAFPRNPSKITEKKKFLHLLYRKKADLA
jgi:hypothetical protein